MGIFIFVQLFFNYKFIKEQAGAGNWRRGYEYHLKDMVFEEVKEKEHRKFGEY